MKIVFVLSFVLASAYAATHVNISIAQQPGDKFARNDQHLTEDHTTHSEATFREHNGQERLARLQESSKMSQQVPENKEKGTRMSLSNHNGQMNFMYQKNEASSSRRAPYNLRSHSHQSTQSMGGSKKMDEQERQNQEFERYIQNYHSAPTVETVFESPNPQSQNHERSSTSAKQSANSDSMSQRVVITEGKSKPMHTFERQVALPSSAANANFAENEHSTPSLTTYPAKSSNEVGQPHPANAYPVKPVTEVIPSHPIPPNHPPVPSQSVSPSHPVSAATPDLPAEGNVKYDLKGQNNMDYDQPSYDPSISYNKPHYDQSNYNYDDSQDQDFHNQIPPEIPEHSDGYGGYYGESEHPGSYLPPHAGYLPPQHSYPRPVVTKTIQIAQPALKAKKYEVRHPAIQKEFYDIEERVVIKPAGTIVVELDRPVAKIPKGETILPLGHPHPAVAAAYHNSGHGVIQTQFSTGAYSNNNGASTSNKQYNPSPVYSPQPAQERSFVGPTTIASTITTTPSYDQSKKDDFVEANLNRQFNSDVAQYATTTENTYSGENQNSDEVFIAADNQGHQRSYADNGNGNKPVYSQDEKDFRYDVSNKRNDPYPLNHNQNSNRVGNYNYNTQPGGQNSFRQYQNNQYKSNNSPYKAEYLTDAHRSSKDQANSAKQARLQEEKKTTQADRTPITHVIKHEHNIHLPPSQHNIYLSRSEPVRTRFHHQSRQPAEEEAHVQEIKPYLQKQKGPVVVYASTKVRESPRHRQNFEPQYSEPSRRFTSNHRSQNENFENKPQNAQIQYSAPYSQMRYHPDEHQHGFSPSAQKYPNAAQSKASLILETKQDDKLEDKPQSKEQMDEKMNSQAHIHIQIPHHPEEQDKPLVITSSINPNFAQTFKNKQSTQKDSSSEEEDKDNSREQDSDEHMPQKTDQLENKDEPDCHDGKHQDNSNTDQHFQRIVEQPALNNEHASQAVTNVKPDSVDLNLKSTNGHVTPGSRVIAATPAPTDASAHSESFHKRRIVVNHPFQTVREVVEHEPITNYHQVKVNEPASPALYQAAYYQQSHGALHNSEPVSVPFVYHQSTHGNLRQFVAPSHAVAVSYHHS